jgi:hypothetical protein
MVWLMDMEKDQQTGSHLEPDWVHHLVLKKAYL